MPEIQSRRPLNLFVLAVPLTLYLVTIYYAINKRLFPYRNIFASIAIFACWETCTNYAILDSRFNAWNFFLGAGGCSLVMKLVEIATLKQPVKRKSEKECPRSSLLSISQFWDAVDYSFDLRGVSWDFGRDFHIPPETRSTSSLFSFEADTLRLFIKHGLLCDLIFTVISQIGTITTIPGGTIFVSARLPPPFHAILVPQFFTALFVSVLTGLAAYHALMAVHLFTTFLVAPFYASPAQSWPPLFGNPLHATSVHNFWSYQWHSVLRRGFWCTGGQLGWKLGGGVSAVLGVFLVSGLLHDFGMWCLGQGMELSRVTSYFVLQGLIVILEKTFDVDVWVESTETEDAQKITVRASISGYPKKPEYLRRCSSLNRHLMMLWTVFWVTVPATLMIDAWARHGLLGILRATYELLPFEVSPSRVVLRLLGIDIS